MQKKVFVISLLLLTITINTSFAIVGDFGGTVGPIFLCANGILFYLTPPPTAPQMAGTYMFLFGTLLYRWHQLPRPMLKVVGKAFPGGCCLVCTPAGCFCIYTNFTVIFMGTSLF